MDTWREKFPLESTKPLKKTISSSFSLIIMILIFGIISFSSLYKDGLILGFEISTVIISLVIFLLISISLIYVYEIFYMKYYFYDFDGKNLVIKKGVFSKNEITLPINRLQDVYIDQDILDRIFGLYDLHVSSATIISGNLSHIDGLNKENSEKIKEIILSNIHKEDEQ